MNLVYISMFYVQTYIVLKKKKNQIVIFCKWIFYFMRWKNRETKAKKTHFTMQVFIFFFSFYYSIKIKINGNQSKILVYNFSFSFTIYFSHCLSPLSSISLFLLCFHFFMKDIIYFSYKNICTCKEYTQHTYFNLCNNIQWSISKLVHLVE